jgi:hypothetical protein
MTLKELKEFIASIPEHMDDFIVVNGEVGYLDPEDDTSMVYRVDNPIITVYVDEHTKEVCLFHQTKEDVNNVFPNNNVNGDT